MKYCSLVLLLLNTEFCVAPLALRLGWVSSPNELAMLLVPCGMIGLVFSFFLVDQVILGADKIGVVHKVKLLVKAAICYLEKNEVFKKLIDHVRKFLNRNRDVSWAFRILGKAGLIVRYAFAFVFTAIPIPIPLLSTMLWVPTVTFCRVTTWPTGLVAMLLGDATKNILYAYTWWKIYH